MAKTALSHLYRYRNQSHSLLCKLVRRSRIERKITAAELAERAGLSRGLVQRIEKGDPGCAIGAVFEAAAIVGVRLFDADQAMLSRALGANAAIITLLPRSVRSPVPKAKDDF